MIEIPKVRTVDMCQYLDNNMHRKDLSEDEKNKVYVYIYSCIFLIAKSKQYLYNDFEYASFSTYLAEKLYFRFTDDRQYLSKDDPNHITLVKHSLSYINKVLYPKLLEWRKVDEYKEVLESSNVTDTYSVGRYIDTVLYREKLKSNIESSDKALIVQAMLDEIDNIPKTIYNVCKQTQYKNDRLTIKRLYMSCMLSFLSEITLPTAIEERRTSEKGLRKYDLDRYKEDNSKNSIILWQLDDSMHDYIVVLLNRIKKQIVTSIYGILNQFVITDNMLDSMISYTNDRKGSDIVG